MLTQLIYSSRATRNLNGHDISLIVSSSQRNNALRDLTGALCFVNDTFVQCFEGERSAVNLLYKHLLQDTRHKELEILSFDEIAERRFATWAMGFFSHKNKFSQLYLKHSRMAEFAPFSMTAFDVNKFFDEVALYVTVPE